MTGQPLRAGEIDAAYWVQHVRAPVQFQAGMETLQAQGGAVFVEVGPHPVLLGLGQQCGPAGAGVWLATLRKGRPAWETVLTTLGELYVHGVPVDWAGVDRDYPRRKVTLPTYPFQRQRYWIETSSESRLVTQTSVERATIWDKALAAGRYQAEQAPLDLALSSYGAKWEVLNRLATTFMIATLRSFGAFARAGESASVESLIAAHRIQPTYRRLVRRWLNALVAEGVLVCHDDLYTSPAPLREPELGAVWNDARQQLGDLPFLLDYLGRCGDKLAAVLTGTESPLETLFPGGSFETADHLYNRWSMVRYFNGIVSSIAVVAAEAFGQARPLRVIEVGAGTGGTTATVVPRLPAASTRYLFTDTSEVFLSRAAERFSAFPFMSYGILDIERSPQEQGFVLRDFDLVIAANVLHATRDLGETIEHVLSLLAPGGLLLLYETTTHPCWFDVTVGLVEGWQRFADERRGDNPLLGSDGWSDVLRAGGFEEVVAFPGPGSPAGVLIGHVLLARAPGGAQERPARAVAASLVLPIAAPPTQPTPTDDFKRTLVEIPAGERHERLVEYVGREAGRVLRRPGGELPDRRHRLMDLGFDSLMGVEFRNRLRRDLDLTGLPATLIFDYPTLEAVASLLGKLLTPALPPVSVAEARSLGTEEANSDIALRVGQLSETEAEALLLKRLEGLGKR